ncbi:MAG: hypothetical protein VR68_08515 [Peptococcaceae bacterium BRH_c4a]|nr:MAG: hypothetical protein VR68_08515 [Peptococcaceae bacterium BRH_c4a]
MNKKFLIGLIAGGLLLAVPVLSYAYDKSNMWGFSPMSGIPGSGMTEWIAAGIGGTPMSGSKGMMGPSMMGSPGAVTGTMGSRAGMMGANINGIVDSQTYQAVDEVKAKELINGYITELNIEGISPAEMMEFENHFYVELKEDGGKYSHELIVDKGTGLIYPERGPNMMWNIKYRHMGGMMSPGYSNSNDERPPVSPEESVNIANGYLAGYNTGETAAEPHQFYGYYTLHTVRDGQIVGMLSVNSYNGQVWYHNWHGKYISTRTSSADHARDQEQAGENH